MDNQLLNAVGSMLTYSYQEMLVNMVLAVVLGLVVSWVYRSTHKGLSYSQSFTQTILFVAIVVAIVMMVIGASLARAFALVGALSIIRFRTVVKDTKDTAYVFVALAVGMGAGTSNYFLAVTGTVIFSTVAFITHKLNYGALYKSEFILRFIFDKGQSDSAYLDKINALSKKNHLLHIEPSGDGEALRLTYDITLNEGATPDQMARSMGATEGVSEVVLIASKSDVDY